MSGRNIKNKFWQQKALLNSIPDIAWLKDEESRFIAVNEPFGHACGISPAELVGKTDLDIWPKELAERYRADDRAVMESRQTKRVEEPLVDRDGKQKWIETIKVPILGERQEVIGTVGIARDFTDRKEKEKLAEDALRESEERYRGLVDSSPEMIFIVCGGRIVYMNDTGLKLLGASYAGEVVGKPIMAFIHPDSRDLIRLRAQQVVAQRKQTVLMEQKYLRLDGEVLAMQGYTVLNAANGDEALRLSRAAKEDIQLLLTDMVMPGMNGKELAERMTQAFPGIKVLFMSGYAAGDASMDAVLTTGGNLLSKPFTLNALTQKVKAMLESSPESKR